MILVFEKPLMFSPKNSVWTMFRFEDDYEDKILL